MIYILNGKVHQPFMSGLMNFGEYVHVFSTIPISQPL